MKFKTSALILLGSACLIFLNLSWASAIEFKATNKTNHDLDAFLTCKDAVTLFNPNDYTGWDSHSIVVKPNKTEILKCSGLKVIREVAMRDTRGAGWYYQEWVCYLVPYFGCAWNIYMEAGSNGGNGATIMPYLW